MDNNPCYKPPITHRELREENVTTSNEHPLPAGTIKSAKVIKPKTKKTIKNSVSTAVILISMLALILVAILAMAVSFHFQIKTLVSEIQELEQKINQTENHTLTLKQLQVDLDSLQGMAQSNFRQLSELRSTTTSQLDSLHSTVSSLNTIQHTVTTLVNSLQSTVDTLTTQVNSSVNVYQNCIDISVSCEINRASSTTFWKACNTATLPINQTGYYTAGMRCQYESNYQTYVESSIVRKIEDNVRCQCDVRALATNSDILRSLPQLLTATCTLIITRCPL